jgi:hypothetical protein
MRAPVKLREQCLLAATAEDITKIALLLNRLAESAAGASSAFCGINFCAMERSCWPLAPADRALKLSAKTNPTQNQVGFVNNLRATSQWLPSGCCC